MRSRRLGVLVCRLIVGVDEFFAAVVDDGDSQDHESDGQDELQAFTSALANKDYIEVTARLERARAYRGGLRVG